MRRLLKPARRALRRVLVTLIVLIAAVNAAAFLLTPLLDRYRDDLAALASERLGTPVSVGALHARWRGFGPELVLEDLRIGASDKENGTGKGIVLAEAAVDFGIWDMIRHLDLSPLRITLRHLQLHLVRRPDGRVQLTGFEGEQVRGGGGALPLAGRLRLEDATLLWEDQRVGLPVQRFDDARLRLHLWPDRVTLTASLALPGDTPGKLHAGADLSLTSKDWGGEIYLSGRAPALAALVSPYLPFPLHLTQGGADFEVWSDWTASRLSHAEGRLRLSEIALRRGGGPPLTLDKLSTEFRYRREGEDRDIDLARLSLSRDGRDWPLSDLHLSINLAGPGWPKLQLAAEYLNLDDALALSRPWPLPARLAELRDGLQPRGELRDLRLALDGGEGPPRWRLSTRFQDLGNHAWRDYPGVNGLSGNAQGDQDRVALQVAAHDAALDWPALFRAPVPVNYLSGALTWQTTGDGGHELSSQALILDTPDIRSVSRLSLKLPATGPADIDLHSELRDGDGRHTARYLPTRHMDPHLVTWLDRAITSGHIPQGTLLLRGPLRDFPFEKGHTGRFSVRFDVTDLSLDYRPGWPPLQVDDAEVQFQNNSLDITLHRGSIYQSRVVSAEARIDSLDPISPLKISGQVEGPLADPLRLLAETPLKARFGDLAAGVKADGQAQLKLDMAVGLSDRHEDRLDGSLTLKDAKLTVPGWPFPLTHADGVLQFDLNGVQAKDLRAVVDGQKVSIDVLPGDHSHRIQAHGRLDAATLYRRMPGLPAGLVKGDSALTLTLDVPNEPSAGKIQALTLASDLKGMALALPAPLGKDADTARDASLRIPLGKSDAPLRLHYGDLLDALFRPGGDRAALRFGGAAAELPDQPVLAIDGRLAALDLDPWLALAEHRGDAAAALPPIRANLRLGHFELGRTRIDDVKLVVEQQPHGWQGSAESARFAGRFQVKDGLPMQINLARLAFDLNHEGDGTAEPAAPRAGKPADWPDMDLNIASLRINGRDFGRLTMQARHDQGTLRLEPLKLDGPLASFDGMARWRGQGVNADSDLVGKLHTPGLGALLGALGYTPQFEGAPADAELSLSWPGSLDTASLASLRGRIGLSVGQGRLLEVDPGVSRVFGLLNFGALQRRLRLDFSDVFRKGLAFDRISGDFRLIDGNAYTRDLTINGPSGEIVITGRTGLVAHDLYQEVTVTPRFDATLPVAGALAGGPITGIAVLVAQQVMKEKVDKFNRIRYEVTGSWDAPKVERLSGGGGLSQILAPVTDLFEGKSADSDQPPDH